LANKLFALATHALCVAGLYGTGKGFLARHMRVKRVMWPYAKAKRNLAQAFCIIPVINNLYKLNYL